MPIGERVSGKHMNRWVDKLVSGLGVKMCGWVGEVGESLAENLNFNRMMV